MIKKLPSNLINQIAAGEVVDDPASIVKELLENSIDANSDSIEIILFDGGKKKIIVNDNGIGINKNEIKTAFKRFATSKIKNAEDLNKINTLGFRGEALPSIASISEVVIKSKTKKELGHEYKISYGKEIHSKPSSIECGTSIEIKNIFNNLPARKKFLKSENYEYRKILSLFKVFSLHYSKINMRLINNEKIVYDFKGTNLINRISALYTKNISDSLIEINFKKDNYKISGYIGNLSLVKQSRGNQFLYINGRYIKDKLINMSIYSAYRSLIARGEYPFFILFLDLPSNYLDVNVHPKKQEVKFENELQIQHIFKLSISEALKNITRTIPSYNPIQFTEDIETSEIPFSSKEIASEHILTASSSASYAENIKNAEIRLNRTDEDRIEIESNNVWQIHNKYIITEITSGIIIIDQHVAHERILYEASKKSIEEGEGVSSQKVLFPQVVKFNPENYTYLLEIMYYLKKIGFEFREFGDNQIIIEGSPNNLPIGKEEETINEIIEHYIKTKNTKSEFIEYMASTYACKAAIKAGDKLSAEECKELIDELFSTEHPYYCPHGRPIIINLPIEDLDKRFERH